MVKRPSAKAPGISKATLAFVQRTCFCDASHSRSLPAHAHNHKVQPRPRRPWTSTLGHLWGGLALGSRTLWVGNVCGSTASESQPGAQGAGEKQRQRIKPKQKARPEVRRPHHQQARPTNKGDACETGRRRGGERVVQLYCTRVAARGAGRGDTTQGQLALTATLVTDTSCIHAQANSIHTQ